MGSEYADLQAAWKPWVHSGGGYPGTAATEHWRTPGEHSKFAVPWHSRSAATEHCRKSGQRVESQNLVTVLAANSRGTSDQTREAPDDSPSACASRADIGPTLKNFANLFDSPDPLLSAALCWAHANAMHPPVASWLEACSQWDAAVATKDTSGRKSGGSFAKTMTSHVQKLSTQMKSSRLR